MKRKIIFRVVSVLCLIACLLPCFLFLANAEEGSATTSTPFYDTSDVAEDLTTLGFDPSSYEWGTGDFEILYVAELGYTYDLSESMALYIYVYNPSGKVVNTASVSNTVQIADKIENGEAVSFTKFRLKLLDSNENILMKFKVESSDLARFANSIGRDYRISGITLTFFGNTPHEATISKGWRYSGSNGGKDLKCVVSEFGVANIELHATTYNYNNSIIGNTVLYSVYFSVDSQYEQSNVTLTGYKSSAYRSVLSPVVVMDKTLSTDDKTTPGNFYDHIAPYIGKGAMGNDGKSFPFLVTAFREIDMFTMVAHGWRVAQGANSFSNFWAQKSFYCGDSFGLTWVLDRRLGTDWTIDNEELKEYAKTYRDDTTGSITIGDTSYELGLFKETPKYVEIIKDNDVDSFSIKGAGENGFTKFFLRNFWNVKTEDIPDIAPVISVNTSDVNSSTFCDTLLVGDDEADHFKSFVRQERGKGNSVYLLRFATESYTGENLYYHFDIASSGAHCGTIVTDAVAYLEFDLLELHYKKEDGNVLVLPVVSDSVDVVPDIEKPNDTIAPPTSNDDNDSGNDGGGNGIFSKIVAVLLIALLVFLIVKFWKYLPKRPKKEGQADYESPGERVQIFIQDTEPIEKGDDPKNGND